MLKLHNPLTPLRIGIDMDGVLCDFIPDYIQELNTIQPVQPIPTNQDWTEWNAEAKLGYHKDTVKQVWDKLKQDQAYEFWIGLLPCIDIKQQQYIQQLWAQEDCYFITHRPLVHKIVTERWLDLHLGISVPTVLLTGNKGAVADALKLHAMFDDKPENLVDVLARCGLQCMPFLIDRPWNWNFNHRWIKRVHSIEQGISLLNEEIKE